MSFFQICIQFSYGLDHFFLPLAHRYMQRSPILSIFLIHVCAVLNERLGNIIALLRILVKKVHDEVQWRFTIVIGLIHVGSLPYQCLYQPDLQPYDRQVQRTAVDAPAQVHVYFAAVEEDLGRFKILLPYRQT